MQEREQIKRIMKICINIFKNLRNYMNVGNEYIIKDRAHEIQAVLLVFTSTCVVSFILNYL